MQIGFQLPASQHTPERKERTLSQSVPNLDGIKVAKKAKVVQLVCSDPPVMEVRKTTLGLALSITPRQVVLIASDGHQAVNIGFPRTTKSAEE